MFGSVLERTQSVPIERSSKYRVPVNISHFRFCYACGPREYLVQSFQLLAHCGFVRTQSFSVSINNSTLTTGENSVISGFFWHPQGLRHISASDTREDSLVSAFLLHFYLTFASVFAGTHSFRIQRSRQSNVPGSTSHFTPCSLGTCDSVLYPRALATTQSFQLIFCYACGTLGTRGNSVFLALCTLGAHEDYVCSASGTLGTREDSAVSASGTLYYRDFRALKSFRLLEPRGLARTQSVISASCRVQP